MKYTYNEAFNLITEAYIKDEIKPYQPQFCFCGTLECGDVDWSHAGTRHGAAFTSSRAAFISRSGLTIVELLEMEDALLTPLFEKIGKPMGVVSKIVGGVAVLNPDGLYSAVQIRDQPDYEEVLFEGMCAALEVMKQIYIARGLPVDDSPVFTKRLINHKNQVTC